MTERHSVDSFIPGFVGEPGDRTFYLQVDDAGSRSWYLLEKGQVAAFAVDGGQILADLNQELAGEELQVGDLLAPDAVAFRVADFTLTYDEHDETVVMTLVPTDEDAPPVTHRLTVAQLGAAARAAVAAVMAGRPRCPRCGLAMDAEGHVCPLSNGDLRNHRP
ncbi:MAG: DUF3090 family protein [Acidimicrobiia bacterium]|nr:DUF3090 family protein [Acidimicrobiia bacterium]